MRIDFYKTAQKPKTNHCESLQQQFAILQEELVQRLNQVQSPIPRLQENNMRTNLNTRILVAALEALHDGIQREKTPFDPATYIRERTYSPTTG